MEVWIFEVAEQCGERWEEDSKRIDVNPETRRGVVVGVKQSRVLPGKEQVMMSVPRDADFSDSDSDKCFRCSMMYYAHYDSTVIIAFEWAFTREITHAPTECLANH